MRIDAAQLKITLPAVARQGAHANSPAAARETSQTPNPISQPTAPQERLQISFGDGQILIYRFFDQQTGELVQQIPPEEVLRVVRGIQEMLQKASNQEQLDLHA
jgi:hypothetical protein